MLKAHFITKIIIAVSIVAFATTATTVTAEEKKPIVITARTLTTDNKGGNAVFKGSVVATTGDVRIYSDEMRVYYNNPQEKITKIHASGNVRVYPGARQSSSQKERVIFSKEAIYLDERDTIVFTGEPRVIEGGSVITGTQITYFLKDGRAIVQNSRAVLKNSREK